MRKSFGYGITAAIVLLVIATLGIAQVYSVYNPLEKQNVPIDRVTLDQIKAWANVPSFSKWTNMEGLREYLENQGVDHEEILSLSSDNEREFLSNVQGKSITKNFESTSFSTGGEVLTDIECDLEEREVKFELSNVGNTNWFLVDQTLTSGAQEPGRKYLSGALSQAAGVNLFINNYPVNSLSPQYQGGERLFVPAGQTFADACQADFVRSGKSVTCKLEPVPMRGPIFRNSYTFLAPGITEKGTFECE